jgi:hypothetical protein
MMAMQYRKTTGRRVQLWLPHDVLALLAILVPTISAQTRLRGGITRGDYVAECIRRCARIDCERHGVDLPESLL